MGFRCDLTGKHSGSGEKEIRLVVADRDAVYKDDRGTIVGTGREVAKEIRVTLDGLREYTRQKPYDAGAVELLSRLEASKNKPILRPGAGTEFLKSDRTGKPEFMLSGCFSASKGMMG